MNPKAAADFMPTRVSVAARGRAYSTRVAVGDLVAVAVVAAHALRFGPLAGIFLAPASGGGVHLTYTLVSVGIVVAWLVMLSVFRSRDEKFAGAGPTGYGLVLKATLWVFGMGAIAAFIFHVPVARAYILIALPLGLLLLLVNRWVWRQWLVRRRAAGDLLFHAIVVGNESSVRRVVDEVGLQPAAGYHVVGVVVPGSRPGFLDGTDLPLEGDVMRTLDRMRELGASTLIIGMSDQVSAQEIRRLSWGIEPGREHLVMVPGLTDIAGPRIRMRPVAGLHLIHVETPTFAGTQRIAKRFFDILGSAVLIAVSSPLLLVVALLVRFSSAGTVLFRQERVGYQGQSFQMLKFRSMVADAEEQLIGLLDQGRDAGNRVLFKLKDDPRVTPVGRFIRRYSIDELPQLFNVFVGEMSLVGPRPPLPREVATYEDHVHRKFLVRPGITGLWQVSGRSALSWEESVRLDLSYVENWSTIGDLIIIWRTVKAVVGKDGAY